jgi:hypothetical protein
MADNVAVTEGAGTAIGADEISSVKYQRVKLIHGADGVNAGDVATGNPLPVVQTGTPALPTGAATSAKQDTQITAAQAIQTSVELIDDAIKTDDAAFTPGTTKVQMAGFQADESSTDSVDEGDAGAARMTLDRKQIVTPQAHTNGGATPYKLVSAGSTNATSLKASAGQIYSIDCFNINAAVRYLKLYNKASAPTVGTDTPVHVYAIPGATTGGGFTKSIPVGMEFTTGIAFALTTGITDADTGAVAASEILVNIDYK